MADLVNRIWDDLVARTTGPMHLRFFIQPIMSFIFALRKGFRDAKDNQAPYIERLMGSKDERKGLMSETWKDVGKIFIMGIIADIVYQLIIIYGLKDKDRFYPLESILVAFALAIIPYIIFRGPADRIGRLFVRKKSDKS